jgi:hypothetical protein
MSLDPVIGTTLLAQDVELANAMAQLQTDPTKLNTFLSQRKQDLYNAVTREHSDNFQKVFGDLQRAQDTSKNVLYYHVRNKDLDTIQKDMVSRAAQDADNASYDSQNAKRQFEINEWSANNKLDTLFFLQLLFIGLTLAAPLLYMYRSGLIPGSVYYGVTGLVSVALILTAVVRIQYTSKTRDNRFWNRRRFQTIGGPPTKLSCESVVGLYDELRTKAQQGVNAISSAASAAEATYAGALQGAKTAYAGATQ